jgi:3-oxoacyl-(acyl-carrier-protein) synthase
VVPPGTGIKIEGGSHAISNQMQAEIPENPISFHLQIILGAQGSQIQYVSTCYNSETVTRFVIPEPIL